jgi:leucine dehydrogenase
MRHRPNPDEIVPLSPQLGLNLIVTEFKGAGDGALDGTEQVTLCFDRTTGLQAVIAIDDTTLGSGLGGVRWLPYPDLQTAADEARRLARVMTLKNACADLPYGGAKSVLLKHAPNSDGDTTQDRSAQLRAFGRFVDRLGGAYIPGVDMGTSIEDLAVIGSVAHEVSCDHEDPSPMTAFGVFAGIEAALSCGGKGLSGTRVVVQGTGHVGAELARMLVEAEAVVSVADIDPVRARAVAHQVGAKLVDPLLAMVTPCDVLAPCAAARVIDRTNVGELQCQIVAGGANDILATHDMAATLAQRGIVYVPDFVINAGGVIHIHALRAGWELEKLQGSLRAIGDRVASIVREATRTGRTPTAVAEEMASFRLGRPIALPT